MRRVFELHRDHVQVSLKSQHLDAQSSIELKNLRPQVERIQLRPMLPFRLGAFFLMLGTIGLVAWFLMPNLGHQEMIASASAASLIVAIPILALFGRKIEYVRFKSSAEIVVLDVGRSGPDEHQFEAFVDELKNRIQAAQVDVHTTMAHAPNQPQNGCPSVQQPDNSSHGQAICEKQGDSLDLRTQPPSPL